MEVDALVYESSYFQELAARGEIHIDLTEPPLARAVHVERRQDSVVPTSVPTSILDATSTSDSGAVSTTASSSSSSSAAGTTLAIATDTSTTLSPTAVSTSISPSVTVVTTPLPSPFDTSIGSNFTVSSCPTFFSNFLSNSTFQSCLPVSLLLQNSNSFFRAERSTTLLTQTLDSACNAPLAICSPLMSNLASQLIADANCGADYKLQNPLVLQAHAGLVAYEPLYRATCLRDSGSGAYCFAEAVTNTTNDADAYPYYTALGLNMPAGASPTCSQCLKDTMNIFAGYANATDQPLASCAAQVDIACGSGFAATDIKAGSVKKNAAMAKGHGSVNVSAGIATIVVLLSYVLVA
ncbi:hypothetical protein LTR10_019397 [Elasticomyces elasticus]|uniref:DUF7729 domain-containing protein n=1 Tax=Exophiala sideris TaxID=1016849 RepID=A0ABR0IW42_9EURO|nr:hypothetical protein LTR10_019397 [Elasticomyces elasticus]KAK5021438.1 hypothetical protein LTS07_011048 [Exophiala sideris]KAK5025436.1 hypothetical protein LTR13_010513 [Exophiala sideris]KAK5049287.1 hypothetical protein LTR69_011072 [Exophiala sideris]KAK5176960.1 hypothetical protein LTR44_010533 [Eurotiomycetes sp. CCFEE 6388]